MMEVIGLLAPAMLGFSAVRCSGALRGLRPRWAAVVLEISLGVGVGAALAAALFLLLLTVGAANRWVVLGTEFLAAAALATWTLRTRKKSSDEEPGASMRARPKWRWNAALAGGLALALLLVTLAQVDTAQTSPNGEFDAFAMWNARAKLLLGPGDTWQRAYSPMLIRQRPDHPLLLSSFVAQAWRAGGDAASPAAPFGAAMLFYAGTIGILGSALVLFRGLSSALLACLVLLANISFLQQTTWQYADIPAGLYFLGTFVLLLTGEHVSGRSRTAALALSGAFASFAALTKNEGIPFLILTLACYGVVLWRSAGLTAAAARLRPWLLGALPGFLLQMGFKTFLAPSGGPFAGPTASQALSNLADPGRYATVASYYISRLLDLGAGFSHPLILLAILAIVLRFEIDRERKPLLITFGIVLTLQLAAYAGVYLTTLDNIEWRLGTSLNRLYSQVWPSFVLLAFLALGVPRDREESEAARPSPAKKRPEESRKRKKKR